MRPDEISAAMKLINDDYYFLDSLYYRRPEHDKQDKGEIYRLWNDKRMKLHYWQIGKMLRLSDDEVAIVLLIWNIDPYEREDEYSTTLKKYSSRLMLFDGADVIRETLHNNKMHRDEAYKSIGVTQGRHRGIYDGTTLPTRQEIMAYSNALGIDIELWSRLSSDVYQILNDKIPYFDSMDAMFKAEDIGEYDKTLLIRYHIVFNRLRLGLSTRALAERLSICEEKVRAFETCMDHPTAEEAYRICMALGLEQPADVYAARFYPANYLYMIGKQVERAKFLTRKRYKQCTRALEAGRINDDVAKILQQQIEKANNYAAGMNNGGLNYGELTEAEQPL